MPSHVANEKGIKKIAERINVLSVNNPVATNVTTAAACTKKLKVRKFARCTTALPLPESKYKKTGGPPIDTEPVIIPASPPTAHRTGTPRGPR